MIKINNKNYKIKEKIEKHTADVRHLTLVVHGDVRHMDDVSCDIVVKNETLRGVILLPHYCVDLDTTMFLVFVEE